MLTLPKIIAINAKHKIIGFDVDGVLIDSFIPVHLAFQLYADRYGLAPQITTEYVKKYCMVGTPRHIVSNFLNNFRSHLEEHGVDVDLLLGDKLAEEASYWESSYQEISTDPLANEDAIQVLVYLRKLGYIIPLITSRTKTEITKNLQILEKKYRELLKVGKVDQVDSLYDIAICWNDVEPYGKPQPRSMELAIARLRDTGIIAVEETLILSGIIFVGDGASDMEFAKNIAGFGFYIESITPFMGESDYAPDITFHNMAHLKESLQYLGR